jgi:hypothetical protein
MSRADCRQHGFTRISAYSGILAHSGRDVLTGAEVPVPGRVQGATGSEVVINGWISQLHQERRMARPRGRFQNSWDWPDRRSHANVQCFVNVRCEATLQVGCGHTVGKSGHAGPTDEVGVAGGETKEAKSKSAPLQKPQGCGTRQVKGWPTRQCEIILSFVRTEGAGQSCE